MHLLLFLACLDALPLLLLLLHLQLDEHDVFFVVVDLLLIFLSLHRTISGNVSYLITMKTLKDGIVPIGETFSFSLEPFGSLRLFVVSLLEVGLNSSSLGMSG